jgi:hypothetical protein
MAAIRIPCSHETAAQMRLPAGLCHTLRYGTLTLCCTSHSIVNIVAFLPKRRGGIASPLRRF